MQKCSPAGRSAIVTSNPSSGAKNSSTGKYLKEIEKI
jgi:hypothetical protein